MYEFQLWFINFDAIFIRKQLQPTRVILQALPYNPSQALNWPQYYAAPKIGNCFEQLQKFIKDRNNWVICDLPDQILKDVETKINNIMILIATEKQYAIQFWGKQLRRIQASICHFLILFQNLMASLIVPPHRTLKSCQLNGVLLTKLSLIQQFVNKILQNVQSLVAFLGRKEFRQQKEITNQFCTNFAHVIENLPNMTAAELTQSPKLMLYITINNPIQISEHLIQDPKYRSLGRPKAQTVENQKVNAFKKTFLNDKRFRKFLQFKDVVNLNTEKNYRRKSCSGRLVKAQFQTSKQKTRQKIVFFRLPQKIVRFSFNRDFQKSSDKNQKLKISTMRQRTQSLVPAINRKHTVAEDKNNQLPIENFTNSVRLPKKTAQTRDKSETQMSLLISKRSEKSRERAYLKKIVEPDVQAKRQYSLVKKQVVFTTVKNLWSAIKFNKSHLVKKQPIILTKGTQKRAIWAPQGYEEAKEDELRQKIQELIYKDSQQDQAQQKQFQQNSTD